MTEIPDPPDGRPTAKADAVHRARTDGGVRALLARAMWRRGNQPSTGAQTMGYVYELADRIAEHALPQIERRAVETERAAIVRNIRHYFAASGSDGPDGLWDDVEVLCGRIERGEYGANKEDR